MKLAVWLAVIVVAAVFWIAIPGRVLFAAACALAALALALRGEPRE